MKRESKTNWSGGSLFSRLIPSKRWPKNSNTLSQKIYATTIKTVCDLALIDMQLLTHWKNHMTILKANTILIVVVTHSFSKTEA